MSWQGKEICKYGDGPWKNLGGFSGGRVNQALKEALLTTRLEGTTHFPGSWPW